MNDQPQSRPDWDSYLMSLACLVSLRSPDPSTKHGSIIVDSGHRPLGFGYNCYPGGGIDDSVYPLTRPEKYKFMVHSERNAIDNCHTRPEGATLYVTGAPCSGCMQGIIQAGIKKVILGNIGSSCVDMEDLAASRLMAVNHKIKMISYSGEHPSRLFESVTSYLERKWQQQK